MAAYDKSQDKEINDSALPPAKKNGWKYIFAAIAVLSVIVLVLTAIYREIPRRNAIVKRSKTPITRAVYALALSPIDSATARIYRQKIAQDIGRDSASTKMVVGSTAVAQQFVSFADFHRSLLTAFVGTRPANIRTQNVLSANIANFIIQDQLPSRLYIIGHLGTDNPVDIEKHLGEVINALQIRNQLKGPLAIISCPAPIVTSSHRAITAQFFSKLKERGLSVQTEDIAAQGQ